MADHEKRKKLEQKVTAVAVSLGILLSGMFHSPADLVSGEDRALPTGGPAIVEMIAPDTDPGDDGDVESEAGETDEKKRKFATRMRMRIGKWPIAVRAAFCLPLWGAGWLLTGALSLLWQAALPPVLALILHWVVTAVMLLAVVAASLKIMFPGLKLKDVFTKKRLGTVLIGCLSLCGLEGLLQLFGAAQAVRTVVKLSGTLGILALIFVPLIRENRKNKTE